MAANAGGPVPGSVPGDPEGHEDVPALPSEWTGVYSHVAWSLQWLGRYECNSRFRSYPYPRPRPLHGLAILLGRQICLKVKHIALHLAQHPIPRLLLLLLPSLITVPL